jgi:hypothetical protein
MGVRDISRIRFRKYCEMNRVGVVVELALLLFFIDLYCSSMNEALCIWNRCEWQIVLCNTILLSSMLLTM